jgi:hypothetical protein
MYLGAMYAILRSQGDEWRDTSFYALTQGIGLKAGQAKPPHKRKKKVRK